MMSKKNISFLSFCFVIVSFACKTSTPITPPEFDYKALAENFFNKPSSGHFPLTVNRGASLHPVSLPSGYLFYTNNRNGSGDIWVRSMHNTINLPVIRHPAEQNFPALPSDGSQLVFVSQHLDSRGDLMFLKINPERMVQNSLRGLAPVNYWDNSQNLSDQIEVQSEKLHKNCRGKFSEKNPVFSQDGKYLFYISNRCNENRDDAWVVKLEDGDVIDAPVRLTEVGASQISLSHDMKHLLFISGKVYGNIYELELQPALWRSNKAKVRKIDLSESPEQEKRRLITSPVLSSNGKYLFYQIVQKDTNFNGYLDLDDHGSIHRVNIGYTPDGRIQTGAKKPLIESSTSVISLTYSTLVDGSIIYASKLYNSVNLYFMQIDGVVPQKRTIQEQYEFSKNFRSKSRQRYLIALDSVFYYYGDTPEYVLYEGKILFDKINFYKKNKNTNQLIETQKDLKSARIQNSYIDLDFRLNKSGFRTKKEKIKILEKYILLFEKQYTLNELVRDSNIEYQHALYLLALFHKENNDLESSKKSIKKLNKNFPTYFRFADSLLLEAWIMSWEKNVLSTRYADVTQHKKFGKYYSDLVHKKVYNLLKNNKSKFNLSKELKRQDLPALIKATIKLVQANQLLEQGHFKQSLSLADSTIASIPMETFRKRRRPFRQWNGLFVRLWQLKVRIHEATGNYTASYFDKLAYGGAYNNQSSAEIDESEFISIIDDSDLFIKNYLQSARELAQFTENTLDAELRKNKVRDALGLSVNPVVEIDSINRDILIDFCKPDSKNSNLFLALGGEHAKNYIEFCTKNANQLLVDGGKKINLENIKAASSLLYTGAYAYTSMLNLLFFNMHGTNAFQDLYKSRAYYYHKLKIDIAREKQNKETIRSQKFVFIAGQEEALKLLREKDPFDSKIYDELAYGYALTSKENIQVGDTAMLLGHAYLLVTRAAEKEKFYEKIQAKGGGLSVEFLRDKKEEILQDFKNAEYILKYIQNIDPLNSESYLMLGWMYQYLDSQQHKTLKLEATYLNQLYDYFTDSQWVALDKNHYSDFYQTYFNFRFYETNIDLYKRYLEIYKETDVSPQKITAVYLNLANNYFLLLNFREAINHYRKVRKNIIRHSANVLASYKKEALFNLNFGRAYFFESKPRLASKHIKRAFNIYERNELNPLNEQIEFLNYSRASRNSNLAEYEEIQLEKLLKARKKTIQKLSLILALNGMADWDSGNYERSIINYRTAINNLSDFESEESGLDQTSLLNFLAISYQGAELFDLSDASTSIAMKQARDKYLIRDESKYKPETIGGNLLGCIIDFGEDFSVVGEGRNPHGFSSLRQYELSLGIQFQNQILKGDLDGATYLMKQRKQVFLTRDIDRKLGRSGFINIISQQGKNNYLAGDYDSAITNFKDVTKASFKYKKINSYRINFINSYKALFAKFERLFITNAEIKKEFLDEFEVYEKDLILFKNGFKEKIIEEYIQKMQAESPDYEYDEEIERATIEKIFVDLLTEINEIESLLLFYKGIFFIKSSEGNSDLSKASEGFKYLAESQKNLAQLAQEYQLKNNKNLRHYFRIKLNQARAALASGNHLVARRIATDILERSFEYNMLYENFSSHYLMAESINAIPNSKKTKFDHKRILFHIDQAANIIKEKNEAFEFKHLFVRNFFYFAADYFVEQKNPTQALLFLENDSEFYLMQEYLRYPLKFNKPSLQKQYNNIRKKSRLLIKYHEDEIQFRIIRKDVTKLERKKAILRARLNISKKKYSRQFPLHRPYVEYTSSINPDNILKEFQVLIQFLEQKNQIVAFCIRNKRVNQYRLAKGKADVYFRLLKSCLPGKKIFQDIFIIPARDSLNYDFYKSISKINTKNPRPVLISRVQDLKQGIIKKSGDIKEYSLNVFNVDSYGKMDLMNLDINPIDIVSFSLDTRKNVPLFAGGEFRKFNARKWVENHREHSIVIVQKNKEADFDRIMGLYEILRLKGVGTIVFTKRNPEIVKDEMIRERGLGEYSQKTVFGFRGFQMVGLENLLRSKSVGKMLTGESWERKNEPQRALAYYTLANAYLAPFSKNKKNEGFRNQLNVLRVKLKLDVSNDPEILIDDYLKKYSSNQEAKESILVLAIKTLTILAEIQKANKYLKILERENYKKYLQSKNDLKVLTLVVAMQTVSLRNLNQYSQQQKKHVVSLFPQISRANTPKSIIPLFLKHGLYGIQEKYLQFLENRKIYLKNIPEIREQVYFERLLLNGKINISQFQEYLNNYKDIYIKNNDNSILNIFRKQLLEFSEKHIDQKAINIHQMKNKSLSERTSIYNELSIEERSFLFYLLSQNIEYDVDLQIRKSIDELILVESRIGSLWRAWQMTLQISEKQLELSDLSVSFHYYKKLRNYSYSKSLTKEDQLRYQLLHTVLATNFRIPSVKFTNASQSLQNETVRQNVSGLFNSVPIQFASTEIQEFIKNINAMMVSNESKRFSYILNSILIAKNNAILLKKWSELLNLEALGNKIRIIEATQKGRTSSTEVSYIDVAEKIIKNMPKNQVLFVIIPFKSGSYKITVRNKSIQADVLPHSGRRLQARQMMYLRLKNKYPTVDLNKLQKTFRRFFIDVGNSSIVYFWFGHNFALSPLKYYEKDRLYQIASLESLSKNRGIAFKTKKAGIEVSIIENKFKCQQDSNLINQKIDSRIQRMERHVIKIAKVNKKTLHFLNPMLPCSIENQFSRIKGLKDQIHEFFMSRVYFPKKSRNAFEMWYKLQNAMNQTTTGRGVITLSLPSGMNHAYMIKEFYNKKNIYQNIDRRFILSYLQMYKKSMQTNNRSGQYRLITDRFVLE